MKELLEMYVQKASDKERLVAGRFHTFVLCSSPLPLVNGKGGKNCVLKTKHITFVCVCLSCCPGLAIAAIARRAHDTAKDYYTAFLPVAFVAMRDVDREVVEVKLFAGTFSLVKGGGG